MNGNTPTNRVQIEEMCAKAGMQPIARSKAGDYDIYVSDGFSLPPHRAFNKFGVDPDEFKNGCYVTFWWLMRGEENLLVAAPAIFDVYHDMSYDPATKKQMRANKAIEDATAIVGALKKRKVH